MRIVQIIKVEISKVGLNSEGYFETSKMIMEKTWTFQDTKSIKVFSKESVTGNLEPRAYTQIGDEYNTYYVKINYKDNSIEEWLLWLDNSFSKDGAAENKVNLGKIFGVELIEKGSKRLETSNKMLPFTLAGSGTFYIVVCKNITVVQYKGFC